MFSTVFQLTYNHAKMSPDQEKDEASKSDPRGYKVSNPKKGKFVFTLNKELPASAICYASAVCEPGDKDESEGAQRIISVTDLSTKGFTIWNVSINGGGKGWKPTNDGSFFVTVSTAQDF